MCELNWGKHGNPHLQNSWAKYGEDAFEFSVFAYCDKENLLDYEQILLDLHVGEKGCYNVATKAGGGCGPHTEEAKRKMSLAHKGHKHSDETKAKMSKVRKGKVKSADHLRNISLALQGKTYRKVSCPHCGKVGGANAMGRYHFDQCKHKGE